MNKTLMQIVLDSLAFFELADDATVDPDAAIGQMEAISASLRQMAAPEQREFLAFAADRAESLRGDPAARDYVEFLDGFPEAFGVDNGD